MTDITVCLTSCNRFDLLQITMDSFFKINNYPIKEFIINEDSGNISMRDNILSKYGDRVKLIFNPVNLGIYKSIDNIYNIVSSEYIFHCEDDWRFESNHNFMQDSLNILEEKKDIHQVWIRKDAHPSWIEHNLYTTPSGTRYKMMKNPHCGDWCGFSHNPGLRRLSDYKKMFPNGFSEFILSNQKAVFTEHNCNLHAAKQGYRAAILENKTCVHIGDGRSTIS